ncbi:NADPH:quinone reductase [Algirhabdus cladophorae]|uniref:NADPH:quinone reductase n=1 Tax=Algirhabdus cladophorae TaxID=3377108 RepID=UPI003B849299
MIKSIVATARGAAKDVLRVEQIDAPVPMAGEVCVQVKAVGVNPSDVKLRVGAQGPMVADQVAIHNDGAGVITAVGDGVDPARVGQHVWLYQVNRTDDGMGQGLRGTAAEVTCVPSAEAVAMPQTVDFELAACLGVPAMTAHRALFCFGDVAGQTVLVTGGAGSVGELAVQMAADAGATVITTVSSDEKAEIAKAAGAAHIINYRTEDLEQRLIEIAGQNGLDHVVDVDFAAHIGLTPQVLRRNGTIAAYASGSNLTPTIPYGPVMFNNTGLQLVFVYGMPQPAKDAAIAHITDMLERNALRPTIAARFALEDVVSAHEAVEAGQLLGNAVLTV